MLITRPSKIVRTNIGERVQLFPTVRTHMESSIPTLLVGSDRKLVAQNGAAEKLLRRGGAITLGRDGSIRLATPQAQRALEAALNSLATQQDQKAHRVVRIDGGTPGENRFLIIAKVSGGGVQLTNGHAVEVVFRITVRKPHRQISLSEQNLVDGFELTPTEARLALAIGNGSSLNEFAAASGIAISTVRWHMTNVRRKTGTDSQIALVRLLLALDSESDDD